MDNDMMNLGTRVKVLYPNEPWGEGTVTKVMTNTKLKPLVVVRDDGVEGFFFPSQLAVVK